MCIHVLSKKYKKLLGPIKRALVKSANIRNTVSHFFSHISQCYYSFSIPKNWGYRSLNLQRKFSNSQSQIKVIASFKKQLYILLKTFLYYFNFIKVFLNCLWFSKSRKHNTCDTIFEMLKICYFKLPSC